MIGRFLDALLVDEHDPGHDHRLRLRPRLRESPLDQKFIDALSFHIADITRECDKLSHWIQAWRREALVTARGVSVKWSSAAQL